MKTLSEKISWYGEVESRRWKRILHCAELSFMSVSAAAILAVMQIYGNGTSLQPVFMLFTLLVGLSAACLVPAFINGSSFKRWHMQVVSLGLGCGVGTSAVAAFVILELQLAST